MIITYEDLNFGNLDEAQYDFDFYRCAVFRNFLSPDKALALRRLVFEGAESLRKDFLMPSSGHSPRHMSVISGHVLNQIPAIYDLYHDSRMREVLTKITEFKEKPSPDEAVIIYEDPLENIVATKLDKSGDTHGWHKDDPALALIICLEAPPIGAGGELEYTLYLRGHVEYEIVHLNVGDAYLLDANYSSHRVRPLTQDGVVRSILNLTYDYAFRMPNPNGSANLLFGPS